MNPNVSSDGTIDAIPVWMSKSVVSFMPRFHLPQTIIAQYDTANVELIIEWINDNFSSQQVNKGCRIQFIENEIMMTFIAILCKAISAVKSANSSDE